MMTEQALQRRSAYRQAGIDTDLADSALNRITDRLKATWANWPGMLDFGYYANVVDIGGTGIALCTDGVGSKALIAQMMEKYDTIGIDCVAMNVNDLICVGARPVSMVDYIAAEEPHPVLLEQIAMGLAKGAQIAGVSITGGEIAQIPDMIRGHGENLGFDLVGMAVGVVEPGKIITGQGIQDGDIIIGIKSNGIHSNGLTLARKVLFQDRGLDVSSRISGLDVTLGEELLKPTHIYVKESMALLDEGIDVKALFHITSDSYLNLLRADARVGYVIENLPPVPPIFSVIQEYGGVPMEEMFQVFNMGIGFCYVVSPSEVERSCEVLSQYDRDPMVIGRATNQKPGVVIQEYNLRGVDRFEDA